jgi:transglutaminase-like putative cysteine protease
MDLRVLHETRYVWDAPLAGLLQQVRLTPRSGPSQTVRAWDVEVDGGAVEASYDDHWGARVILVSAAEGAERLTLRASGEVSTLRGDGISGPHRGPAPRWAFLAPTARTEPGDGLRALAGEMEGCGVPRLHALSKAISERVEYLGGATDAGTTAEAALAGGRGVCQDHAQIFAACARLLGYPARYVSGYLALDDRIASDATHGWAEALVEGVGWVGFDPSNGISPDERYVRVATGPDSDACAPIRGLRRGGAAERLEVSVQVQVQQ